MSWSGRCSCGSRHTLRFNFPPQNQRRANMVHVSQILVLTVGSKSSQPCLLFPLCSEAVARSVEGEEEEELEWAMLVWLSTHSKVPWEGICETIKGRFGPPRDKRATFLLKSGVLLLPFITPRATCKLIPRWRGGGGVGVGDARLALDALQGTVQSHSGHPTCKVTPVILLVKSLRSSYMGLYLQNCALLTQTPSHSATAEQIWYT